MNVTEAKKNLARRLNIPINCLIKIKERFFYEY